MSIHIYIYKLSFPRYCWYRSLILILSGYRYSRRDVSKDDIEEAILAANTDSDVDGIIVYYPIFNNRQDQYLQQIVDISKDVEGLSHRYVFNMYQNIRFLDDEASQKSILPCTPLAIVKILEYLQIYNTILPFGNRLHGHTICVVNRSEVVGRPLAALLANDGACVYSVDVTGVQKFTRGEGLKKRRHEVEDMEGWTIKDAAPLCDVVITGVPGDSYKFDTSLLRGGAVCINFSSEKNFAPAVKDKASIYVPSIGKVTIVVLLRNLLVCFISLSLSLSCVSRRYTNVLYRGLSRIARQMAQSLPVRLRSLALSRLLRKF